LIPNSLKNEKHVKLQNTTYVCIVYWTYHFMNRKRKNTWSYVLRVNPCLQDSRDFSFVPYSFSAKNPFCPPHSWPSLETASCVPLASLPSTTRQPSYCASWSGLGWRTRRNCQCLCPRTVLEGPSEYNSRESPTGVVVQVIGIRILHLANLQCGRRRMTFMAGSGRSRNYILCGEKGKPTGLYFCVIME